MIIKKLFASFGTLEDQTLELDPGLNIIYGPNEKGKSSWTAFIRAMLYGINTKERDKAGHLTEKNKFRPWSGKPMQGRMELHWLENEVHIERSALGQSPMKKLDVRYAGTGQEVLELMHENLGETLLSVPEKVFERGAFIRQNELKIEQTGSLEQRIQALITTGDETLSYTDIQSTLSKWQNQRKSRVGKGEIPRIQEELDALGLQLAQIAEKSASFYEVSRDFERSVVRVKELLQDKEIHDELEDRNLRQKIQVANAEMQEKQGVYLDFEQKLQAQAKNITEEQLALSQAARTALGEINIRYTQAESERKQTAETKSLLKEALTESGFSGQTIEQAKETVSNIHFQQAAAEEKAKFKTSKYTIPMAIVSLFMTAALSFYLVAERFNTPALGLTFLFALAFLILAGLLFHRFRVSKALRKRSSESLQQFGVTDLKGLDDSFAEYERLSLELEKTSELLTQNSELANTSFEELQIAQAAFMSAIHSFAPQITDMEEAFSFISVLIAISEQKELAARNFDHAKQLYDNLRANYTKDETLPIPDDGLLPPLRTKSETLFELDRLQKEHLTLKEARDIAQGEVSALGDPLTLSAKQISLSEEKEKRSEEFHALQLALDVLGEADREMQSRYSPKLGEKAGQYLDFLTNGAYKRVVFDRELTPTVEQAGESLSRDVLFLSSGTQDQIYLALRLALCDLAFPVDCPIILDDALVRFDDKRMERALDLLLALSKKRQILLFSCHGREAAYLSEKAGTRFITL